ncbi:GntR family transcriptional regulator [Amphibacillus sp. Q70]|uniref:GntR family transcriptional regulator n=1 Tax=Amphibacillus sp. Q70 TaxID=3453416 RepID=UPI003F8573F2
MSSINKVGFPLYRQIYDDLLDKILRKEYSEGEILPSETELQRKYQVSRITIRKSIGMLQDEGYVRKSSGIGTVVVGNKQALQLEKISSFSDDNLEHQSLSQLIDFQIIEAPVRVLMNLNLKKKTKVYLIERLRVVDKEIVGYHRVYIPTDCIELSIEKLSDPQFSLYKSFEEHNLNFVTADETIEAMIADEKIQQLLSLPDNSALLHRKRSLFDENNRAMEYVEMFYRADRYKYKVTLEKR